MSVDVPATAIADTTTVDELEPDSRLVVALPDETVMCLGWPGVDIGPAAMIDS